MIEITGNNLDDDVVFLGLKKFGLRKCRVYTKQKNGPCNRDAAYQKENPFMQVTPQFPR